jgi:hypothetical protein
MSLVNSSLRNVLLLSAFAGSGAIAHSQAVEGIPHPNANAWPERQVAMLIQYSPFPSLTGDSPRIVLYDDGTILRGEISPSGEMQYLVSALTPVELRDLLQSIGPASAFRALKETYNLAPDVADLLTVGLTLSDHAGVNTVEVIGYSLDGPAHMSGSLRADSLPKEFDRLCKLLMSVKPRNVVPWVPKYVEVMILPNPNSTELAPQWPAKWPSLTDRLAFRRGDSYSLMLNGSDLPEFRALVSQSRTVEIGGKKWMISFQTVMPGGTWAKRIEARRQAEKHAGN